MFIRSMTIYGYGKLENKSFAIDDSLQVFFGENEAGKSTIMSFIHSILFGFPTKQQIELRYEPKHQYKYGGKMTVFFPKHGLATIERVKGKAQGDVTVTLENGRRGQEELLEELLRGVDKGLFQSIFSFNLQGLQNIHQLKSEELGRFLFSTGIVGSDALLKAENDLQKELDQRFRPNGKKPQLNEKLVSLKEKHRQLKIAEKTNSQYEQLLEQRQNIEESLKAAEETKEEVEKEKRLLEEWIKIKPIVNESNQLKTQLERYKESSFPLDGLKRWEKTKERILAIESSMQHIDNKLKKIEEEQKELAPDFCLLDKEGEIVYAMEKLPVAEQWTSRINSLLNQASAIEAELQVIEEKLHIVNKDELIKSNTSVFLKEQCAHANAKQRRLKEQREELDHRLNEEQKLLEKLEKDAQEQEKVLLSSDKRKHLEEQADAVHKYSFYKERSGFLEKELSDIKKQLKQNQKKRKNEIVQWSIFTLFWLITAVLGVWNDNSLFMFVGLIASFIGGVLLFRSRQQYKREYSLLLKKLQEVKKEWQTVQNILDKKENSNLSYVIQTLKEDDDNREKSTRYKVKLEQQNESYEKVLRGFEKWEQDMKELEVHLKKLGKDIGISEDVAMHFIEDAFLLLEQWKNKSRERDRIQKEIAAIETDRKEIEQTIIQLYQAFFPKKADSIQNMCFHLKAAIKNENEKKIRWNENARKQAEYKRDIEGYEAELSIYLSEKEQLFQLAEVDNEESFRERAKLDEEKKQYMAELAAIQLQLDRSAFQNEKIAKYRTIEEPEMEVEQKDKQIKEMAVKSKQWMEELAKLNFDIVRVETGGTYTELLHSYKQLKAEFEEEAKEWGKYAVAKQFLSQTVEQYKNKQLPKMLQKAEEYFTYLTEGKYKKIIPKEDGAGFLVESKDQMLFEAKELSQGTTEQLYVSIRLALAKTFYRKYQLPIIIDDSFVNFDEKRTSRVIQLLKSNAENQLLFFTCHPHIVKHFQKEEVLYLSVAQAKYGS
ncbi:AAA family ATPase [Niallia sp. 03190]|uniref:AAA family ATPase n=1 Tax=Niallia sp. 03190 TaxID=3458061 RepID=UPI004043F007